MVRERIDFEVLDDLGALGHSAVVRLRNVWLVKPKHDPIAIRFAVGVAEVRMLVHIPVMQLKDQRVP